MWLLFLLATLGSAPATSHARPAVTAQAADPWALLARLEGTWEGQVDGKLGTGKGLRTYERILGDRFLLVRHRSVRLPQDKSPEGDRHEELSVFSFDTEREKLVYREFMIEGVVVRSTCEVDGDRIVCTSEAVESGPEIRARLTLEIPDPYHFTEIYELGFSGREPERYITVQWTRSTLAF